MMQNIGPGLALIGFFGAICLAQQTIPKIQGSSGSTSPIVGQSVSRVMGIVTAVSSNRFFFQDPTGDQDDTTSDAMIVFTNTTPTVSIGDMVTVSGIVEEYTTQTDITSSLSMTQITSPTVTIQSSNNNLPSPILIGGTGRIPPTESMIDAVTFFGALEAMRVTLVSPLCIAGTNGFGEIFAVIDHGRNATGLSMRGTLNIAPKDFNPERVQIDTSDTTISSGIASPNVNTGAVLSDVTGVLGYAFGNFEVMPTESFSVVTASPLTATTTTLSGDAKSLLIGTYNVLNLDLNDSDGDTDIADGRLHANAQIIAVHMNGPDVVGLQEIQDDSGSTDDGVVSASDTLTALVAAIASIDPTLNYRFIDNTFIGDNTNGGKLGGNTRNVYLYNPKRVAVDSDSFNTVVDPTDQRTNSANPFFGSRLPLTATFTFLPTGYVFEVVNNHWTSKVDSAAIVGTNQPFEDFQEDPKVNGGLVQRRKQSATIKQYITGKDNVIVLGNLNEFEFVSPIVNLTSEMTILTEQLPEQERYSTIYQGNSQSLDHILVSAGIEASAEYVHVNSEFAVQTTSASDHDPMVARIRVPNPKASPSSQSPAASPASLSTESPVVGLSAPSHAVVDREVPTMSVPTKSPAAILQESPTTTTTATTSKEPSPSSTPSIGTIVGGTLGGLAGVFALAVAMIFLPRQWAKKNTTPSRPLPRPMPCPITQPPNGNS